MSDRSLHSQLSLSQLSVLISVYRLAPHVFIPDGEEYGQCKPMLYANRGLRSGDGMSGITGTCAGWLTLYSSSVGASPHLVISAPRKYSHLHPCPL